jgi:hypothetical protein
MYKLCSKYMFERQEHKMKVSVKTNMLYVLERGGTAADRSYKHRVQDTKTRRYKYNIQTQAQS